ncbi:phosphatase PAP2 family protein [candidate division KSB1 bacterium]|nr:phosphatase PAP2 family protein [candidate division KSB1 bacterium]
MKIIFISLVLILCLNTLNLAQYKIHPTLTTFNSGEYVSHDSSESAFAKKTGTLLAKKQTKVILATSGAMILCMSVLDEQIDEEYAREDDYTIVKFLREFGRIGNVYDHNESYYAIAGLSAAAVGYGLLTNRPKPVETVKLMAESWICTSIIGTSLKVIVGRHRPYLNDGPTRFSVFNVKRDASMMSFPSGHTSSVLSLMTVVAKQYDHWWVKYPAYAFATSVGFQRMLYRKHWASDVIAGGMLGYLTGSWVVKLHQPHDAHYTFAPYVANNCFGLTIQF